MSSRYQGKIKHYNVAKGFAFIKRDDGQGDIFAGRVGLPKGIEVAPGDVVTFEVGEDAKTGKPCALAVDVVGRARPLDEPVRFGIDNA
jgi:CspA family cold shock protein